MNTAAWTWHSIGRRIYGLALIMKVGIPLLFVLSAAIGGTIVFAKISTQVTQFEQSVQVQIEQIKQNAKAIKKPVEDFNQEFEKVMAALKPVVNAVNKIGDIWPISKLNLNFFRLPEIPHLGPIIDQTKTLLGSTLALQAPLLKMSAEVRQAYAIAVKVATVVSAAFMLWLVALVAVLGSRWSLEFVHGWKLLLSGTAAAPKSDSTNIQAQIDALKAEIGSRKMSHPAGSNGALWLVLLAFLLLFVYAWNFQNRLLDLLHHQPVVQSLPPEDNTEPPPAASDKQKILVALDGKLLFSPGSAALSEAGQETVQKLVPGLLVKLAQIPNRVLVVAGHTDDTPIRHAHFGSNWSLSFARARSVAQLLVDDGLPAQRVVAIGYGESQPRIPNNDAVSRHLNRRVELLLVPMASLQHQGGNQEPQDIQTPGRDRVDSAI